MENTEEQKEIGDHKIQYESTEVARRIIHSHFHFWNEFIWTCFSSNKRCLERRKSDTNYVNGIECHRCMNEWKGAKKRNIQNNKTKKKKVNFGSIRCSLCGRWENAIIVMKFGWHPVTSPLCRNHRHHHNHWHSSYESACKMEKLQCDRVPLTHHWEWVTMSRGSDQMKTQTRPYKMSTKSCLDYAIIADARGQRKTL